MLCAKFLRRGVLMLITEKSKKIAQHYATSSVFNAKTLIKWLLMASVIGVIVGVVDPILKGFPKWESIACAYSLFGRIFSR